MKSIKRFTVTVTFPACSLLGLPETTEQLVANSDLPTLLGIWDNFNDERQIPAHLVSACLSGGTSPYRPLRALGY